MENILSVLTERQWRAAVLFYLEQKTERQVAEELGITAPAVSRILAKSLVRMRACMRRDTAPAGSENICSAILGEYWEKHAGGKCVKISLHRETP